jgi:protein SCO1/2
MAAVAMGSAGCASSTAGGSAQAGASASPTFVPHGAVPSVPVAKPAITLTDTTGAAYDLRARTRDKVTLVYFGYTNCADTCPTMMADIATALRKVGEPARDRVAVVFITTDPKRDTRPVLRRWLDKFDPGFAGLTGTQSQITLALRSIGLPPAETTAPTASPSAHSSGAYDVDHFAGVITFDRRGTLVALYPEGFTATDLATDLAELTH